MELITVAAALLVLLTAIMLAFDLYFAPVVMIVLVGTAGWLVGWWEIIPLAQNTITLFFPYLAAGCVWSVVKWYFYLKKVRRQFDEVKVGKSLYHAMDSNFVGDKVDPLKDPEAYVEQLERIRPKASENKARITAWIAYWPASVVETLLRDSVRLAYEFVANTLDRMSKAVFS